MLCFSGNIRGDHGGLGRQTAKQTPANLIELGVRLCAMSCQLGACLRIQSD